MFWQHFTVHLFIKIYNCPDNMLFIVKDISVKSRANNCRSAPIYNNVFIGICSEKYSVKTSAILPSSLNFFLEQTPELHGNS